jgi:hypothetical protein
VLDFRQSLVNPEKDNQDFAVDAHAQRTQDEDDEALEDIGAAAVLGRGAGDYVHEADGRADGHADPENHLDDDGGEHGAEGQKVFHDIIPLVRLEGTASRAHAS